MNQLARGEAPYRGEPFLGLAGRGSRAGILAGAANLHYCCRFAFSSFEVAFQIMALTKENALQVCGREGVLEHNWSAERAPYDTSSHSAAMAEDAHRSRRCSLISM